MTEKTFAELLDKALTEPGIVSQAYRAFYNYSVGNQLLAMWQCKERNLPIGPLSTFKGWLAKNRHVKRGEKALMLCMPITAKRTRENEQGDVEDVRFTRFIYPNRWFVLAQTEGEPMPEVVLPEWDLTRALTTLDIIEVPFEMVDGNTQGYAEHRNIAVSPVAQHAHKTRFHEIAHVLLGHTDERMIDSERTSRSLREVEAEGVAFLVGEALGLPGASESRGYMQHWNEQRAHDPIPEASARKIFKAATQILEAGRPVPAGVEQE